MFAVILLACQPASDDAITAYLKEKDVAIQRIAARLEDYRIWRVESKLLVALKEARTVLAKQDYQVVDTLIKHIDYRKGDAYPVADALAAYGTSILPYLDAILKNEKAEGRRQGAIACLCKLYEPGGFGKEMAKAKLELLMTRVTPDVKKLLEKDLESPLLK
jgi:hypothetical protein